MALRAPALAIDGQSMLFTSTPPRLHNTAVTMSKQRGGAVLHGDEVRRQRDRISCESRLTTGHGLLSKSAQINRPIPFSEHDRRRLAL